ncbi:MAG: hypothetical protein M3Y53_04765 [Thermoproteota archaeon]|nr:hypothetical protein [Thermoproteota archaeon]
MSLKLVCCLSSLISFATAVLRDTINLSKLGHIVISPLTKIILQLPGIALFFFPKLTGNYLHILKATNDVDVFVVVSV